MSDQKGDIVPEGGRNWLELRQPWAFRGWCRNCSITAEMEAPSIGD